MSYLRSGPSLGAVAVSVWLAGGATSVAGVLVTTGLVLRQPGLGASPALLAACVIGGIVLGTALGAGVVYAVLSWDDDGGPTYARAFAALLAGKVAGLFVLLVIAQTIGANSDGGPLGREFAPLTSLAFVPLGSLGFVVSVWILMSSPGGRAADASTGGTTPWEYKLPPGADWRE